MKETGLFIAVLGVDGAGKSTVIDAIRPVLEETTQGIIFVQHLRPSLLPPLSFFKGKAVSAGKPVVDPHGLSPSGTMGSFVRLTYLTLDYIVGYWLKIRPKIVKQSAIVLFDRYAYDMILDPRRFRIGLSERVAGWFVARVPKPDLVLCLYAAPEVVVARKRELPIKEIRRQIEALQAFARKEPRAVLICTEGSVVELRERVLQTLFALFSTRLAAKQSRSIEVKL